MITRFDTEVGTILNAALKRNGIAENTIVIVTSDNGPSWIGGVDMEFFKSSGGLRGRKAQLFEGGIKVPTVVWWPNHIQPSTESSTPSAFWDWYPTLAKDSWSRMQRNQRRIALSSFCWRQFARARLVLGTWEGASLSSRAIGN